MGFSPASARGPRPRVTRRRAETRARLLSAAFDVFAAHGFGPASIGEVCTAAGYTRGAFYSQFQSLEELFLELYDERAALIATQVAEAVAHTAPGDSVELRLRRVSDVLLLDRDWLLVKTDYLMHAARHPDAAQRLAAHRAELRNVIQARIEQGRGDGPLPAHLGTPEKAARAVIAAYDGVTVQLLLDGDTAAARTWLVELMSALLVPA